MSSQTDTLENSYITGILSVIPGESGPGNIEVAGSLYTNNIEENTDNLGVNVSGLNINDNKITINNVNTPANANSTTQQILYLDSSDNLLKSINNNGIITTYQPTTTKGDLIVHNGITQIRLPIGTNSQILKVNNLTSTGLEWVDASGDNKLYNTSKQITLQGQNNWEILSTNTYGSYFICITPYVYDGSSANYFISRSDINNAENKVRLNTNNSLTNAGTFDIRWRNFRNIELQKEYNEADGAYQYSSNFNFTRKTITLTNTVPVILNNLFFGTKGAYFFSINSSLPGGPSSNIFILKSIISSNTGNIIYLSTSPGQAGNQFTITWPSNNFPSISKTNNNNNGNYVLTDNFQDNTFFTNITLSGNTPTQIPYQMYDKNSFIMKVTSSISDSPLAIFTVSKNTHTINGNITRYSSPGLLGTNLILTWNSNNGLLLNKTDSNYNGVYDISFTCL